MGFNSGFKGLIFMIRIGREKCISVLRNLRFRALLYEFCAILGTFWRQFLLLSICMQL